MTDEHHQAIEQIIAFCNNKWLEADRASPSGFPTADMLTGKKMAYNDVLQYARSVVEEFTRRESGAA
jgi:hypothetical protein